MGKLYLIPAGVVIAMQAALVALVLLATVPIAMGGISVDSKDGASVSYDRGNNILRVDFEAEIRTDLNFSIEGFSCDVRMASGDIAIKLYGTGDITIPGNGATDLKVNAGVPLVTLMMMMMYGSLSDAETSAVIDVHGSTLGGMLSLAASVDTLITKTSLTQIAMSGSNPSPGINDVNYVSVTFTMQKNEMTDQIFGNSPPVNTVPGLNAFTVNTSQYASASAVTVVMSSSSSLMQWIASTGAIDGLHRAALTSIFVALYGEWSA
ncbi:MAG: hypothetical protein LBE47_00170 [Methanomassiliicoccaceae archaeon]|jgi:hypothetical protein|nr:hypothetical protein [Methanomassiliicoccaceae archaeon]